MHNDKIAKEEQRIKNEESKVQRALMKELKDERIRKLKEEEKEKAEMAIREKYTNLQHKKRSHQRKDERAV